jgi:hypothetical protein
MKVINFSYNGFSGKLHEGFASFTAEFIKWSGDPGVAICACSDGVERHIPSFALLDQPKLPVQEKTGVIFGIPSSSKGII